MAVAHRTLTLTDLALLPGAADRVWPGHVALFEEHIHGTEHPLVVAPWRADHLQIVVVLKGALELIADDGSLRVEEGEGLLVQPAVLRAFAHAPEGVQLRVLAMTTSFLGDLPWKPMQESLWRLTLERQGPIVLPAREVDRVAEPMQRLAQRIEHLGAHPRGRELVQNTFMEVLLEFSASDYCPEQQIVLNNGRKDELVARFVELAREQHVRRRRLAYYSDRLAVTSKHLSETVKDITGRTAVQVLDDLLVSRSKQLLHASSRSISEVAYDLAFGDPAVFSKFFKRMTGLSPRAFRAGGAW